jgi:hypothetical protein
MAEDSIHGAPSSSTPDPPVTISVVFVHGLLSGVRSRGLPCDAFLADAGIDPALLGAGRRARDRSAVRKPLPVADRPAR